MNVSGVRTLTSGQQPHSPVWSLQQVVPEAQLLLSSHLTSVTEPDTVRTLSLENQGITREPLEQEDRWGSQVCPLGQQWSPSPQHTAWKDNRWNSATAAFSNVSDPVQGGIIISNLGEGAAAPFVGLLHEAAGGVSGTAGLVVTHVLGRPRPTRKPWSGGPLQGRYLLQPRHTQLTRHLTRLLSHVALEASGTAVLIIITAHSLEGRQKTVQLRRRKDTTMVFWLFNLTLSKG